jgi:hypothetical protein
MPSGVYPREDAWTRFLAKIEVTESCWNWHGAVNPRTGYGSFWFQGKNYSAHVVSCHLFFGTTLVRPRTEAIDHRCRNRMCVRPSHLNPTTMSVNILMALDRHRNKRKTECPKGHPYTVENTIIEMSPTGREWRRCRTCHYARNRGK